MSDFTKKQFKESFINVQFIVITLIAIISIILYFTTDMDFMIYAFLICLVLIILFIIGFFRVLRMNKHATNVRNDNLKYEPYVISKDEFINECKNGLMYSLVRVNNNIYEIEVQLDEIGSTNYDKFTCYINDNEIIGLDNFLNYKFDSINTLNNLNSIEFLEYNNSDPKKYFVNKTI